MFLFHSFFFFFHLSETARNMNLRVCVVFLCFSIHVSSPMELLSSVKYNIKDPELYCGGTMAMELYGPPMMSETIFL